MMMVSSLPMISTTSSPTRSIGNNDSHQIILIILGLNIIIIKRMEIFNISRVTIGTVFVKYLTPIFIYINIFIFNPFRGKGTSYNFIIWLRKNFHQLKTNNNFNYMGINSFCFIQKPKEAKASSNKFRQMKESFTKNLSSSQHKKCTLRSIV